MTNVREREREREQGKDRKEHVKSPKMEKGSTNPGKEKTTGVAR